MSQFSVGSLSPSTSVASAFRELGTRMGLARSGEKRRRGLGRAGRGCLCLERAPGLWGWQPPRPEPDLQVGMW